MAVGGKAERAHFTFGRQIADAETTAFQQRAIVKE
jgi:hypothetical protein